VVAAAQFCRGRGMATDGRLQSGSANSSQALLTTCSWGSGCFPRDGSFQLVIISHLLPKILTQGGGRRAPGDREGKRRTKEQNKPNALWRCWNWHHFPIQAHFLASTVHFVMEKNVATYPQGRQGAAARCPRPG